MRPKVKLSTEDIETKIHSNWNSINARFYFAQVLSGECSVEDTLDDLLSLDPRDCLCDYCEERNAWKDLGAK